MTFKELTFTVSSISDLSEIVPFFCWLPIRNKKGPYYTLGLFFMISGIIKVFTLVTAILYIHNLPAYHLLALLEICFIYAFYRRLSGNKVNFAMIAALTILYTLNTYLQPLTTCFNSNTWTLTALLVLITGLRYLYTIYTRDDEIIQLSHRPDFIITSGWLIYAAGSLFTYLMGTDILTGNPDGFFKNAWFFQCISNIVKNAAICYGFLLIGSECRR